MGQRIFAVVQEIDRAARRITLSHKELLGTWLENAADFRPGDTVTGILRGKHPYGQFVELTPNLSGLTDTPQALPEGSAVSVRIRSIQPERQKIRLQVIRVLGPAGVPDAPPLPHHRRQRARLAVYSGAALDLVPVTLRSLLGLVLAVVVIVRVLERVGQVLLADIVVRIVVRIAVGWGLGAACAVGVDVLQVPRHLTDAAVLNVAHGGNDGVVRGVRLGRGRE